MSEVGVDAWIAQQQGGATGPSLAICAADDDRALGKIALRLPGRASAATEGAAIRPADHPVGELSYWVLPDARGQGLATAAVRAMLERARDTTDIRAVVLDIERDNRPSLRLAQRLGAERRHPQRTEVDRRGTARTMVVFILHIG